MSSEFFVYLGRNGSGETQVDFKDGVPILAWSILREASGRVRSKRIWTHGQPKSMRIMNAIAAARKGPIITH